VRNGVDPLLELFCDRIAAGPANPLPSDEGPSFGCIDKHLLASLLQKAIRRGDLSVAGRAARRLLEIDRPRLWRRLMVTALEDIGIGDVEASVLLIAAATNGRWRACLGGDELLLSHLLPRACSAIKDRSGDHILSIINHEPVVDLDYGALKGASLSALLAIVAMPSLPVLYRIRAALLAAGRYSLTGGCTPDAKNDGAELFETFEDLGTPPVLVEACRLYARRSRDALGFIIPCVWSVWQSEGASTTQISHRLLSAEVLDGMPLYAMDPLRTRLGREAVRRWAKEFKTCPWTLAQLGIALWNFESAACDRTLVWTSGEVFRGQGQRADLVARHVPLDQHEAIGTFMVSHYEALNAVRRTLLCEALAPLSEPPAAFVSPIPHQVPRQPLQEETAVMPSKEVLHLEVGRYRLLADKLKADFTAIDEETLSDTLQGISDLPEIVEAIVRSSLEDECLIEALKLRLETMNARLSRFKERFDKKRELACWAMGSAGINKIDVVDFAVSWCEGV
jgi:hypothetical protein